jgi:hypothetical protein
VDHYITGELERATFAAIQRIKDLQDLVMRQEQEMADLRAMLKTANHYGDGQFERAERLLRAQMHPEDRKIDTAAGNDPDNKPSPWGPRG